VIKSESVRELIDAYVRRWLSDWSRPHRGYDVGMNAQERPGARIDGVFSFVVVRVGPGQLCQWADRWRLALVQEWTPMPPPFIRSSISMRAWAGRSLSQQLGGCVWGENPVAGSLQTVRCRSRASRSFFRRPTSSCVQPVCPGRKAPSSSRRRSSASGTGRSGGWIAL